MNTLLMVKKDFKTKDPVWKNVSDEAKDLVNRMFVSSEERICAKDAL
jgi:hypothetical protein